MCGILGCINYRNADFTKARQCLYHRGPDEDGEYDHDNVLLYHTRLGIQDIKNGQQPLIHNDHVIIFNGEIYNHQNLRKQYKLQCKTNSDTETLLLLYIKIGKDCLNLLDGMFAFAILDKKENSIFLARDRAGEKPLYTYLKNNIFLFASELNAIAAVIKPEIKYENIYQYLRYSFTDSNTPYSDVHELPAGSWFKINFNTLEHSAGRWWNIEDFYKNDSSLSLPESLETIDRLLNESVYGRLNNSDLEVGTFLSGGIDSGLVTAIASKYNNKIKTFTVSFEGQYDESSLAALVAQKYNTDHTRIPISFADLKNDLVKILTNYGEPFADSSAIPSYYVAREAKKHLTVILNGDGADELFGGYRRYVPFSHFDFFGANKFVRGISGTILSVLPFPSDKKSNYNYVYRLFDLSQKNPMLAYLTATTDTFEGYERHFISKSDPFGEMGRFLKDLMESRMTGLEKIMCMDFKYLFANDLLVKMDIATMAHSLEGRTPFLSKDILELAPSLDDKLKINGIKTKFLLRELARKYLPPELINQPKRGFEVPLRKWIDNELKEITFDYLSGETFSETFIDRKFITSLLEKKIQVPPEKRAKMLWQMLALEIWYSECYRKAGA